MRVALGTLAAILLLAPACENCSCGGAPAVDVFLTDSDSGSVVPMGLSQSLGVELQGSGRTITVSNPAKLAVNPRLSQPNGLTLDTFSTRWSGADNPDLLESFGGTEVLSAPPQDSHPAWQVTLMISTDPFSDSNVIAVGQSMLFSWHVGGVAPRSSDPSVFTAYGQPYVIKAAVQSTPGADLSLRGSQMEQQLFYAVAPGRVTLTAPLERPQATNEVGPLSSFRVAMVPNWVCSVESGCSQTTVRSSPHPDYHTP